jgi:hypothetical protein
MRCGNRIAFRIGVGFARQIYGSTIRQLHPIEWPIKIDSLLQHFRRDRGKQNSLQTKWVIKVNRIITYVIIDVRPLALPEWIAGDLIGI